MDKKKAVGNDFHKLKGILTYFRSLKKYFIISSIAILLSILVALPVPYFNMILIDNVIIGKRYDLYKVIMYVWLAILIIRPLLDSVKGYFLALFDMNFDLLIKRDIFSKVIQLPLSYFSKNQLGYIQGRIDNDVNALHSLSVGNVLDVVGNIVTLIFGLIMMLNIHWKLTLVALITVPLTILNSYFFSQRVKTANKQVSETWSVMGGNMVESILGIETIKLFLLEANRLYEYIKNFKQGINVTAKKVKIDLLSNFFRSFATGLAPFFIWGYGGLLIIDNKLTVGQVTAFIGYSSYVISPALKLASFKLNMQTAIAAWERIEEILQLEDEGISDDHKPYLSITQGDITFKNLNFRFENHEEAVLRNIDFRIKQGEKVAFVGSNGSGKSTLIKLLLGLYTGFDGEINIDDKEISKYSLSSLRQQIGVVSQNIFLFKGTILENIKLGYKEASDSEIVETMKDICLDNFINTLPEGYDTKIEERGTNLSGGQKQLISIARALIRKNTKILIFDEATSALDSVVEKYLCENIEKICNGKTFINIVHRPTFFHFVDRVIMFDKGEIAFSGSIKDFEHYSNKTNFMIYDKNYTIQG